MLGDVITEDMERSLGLNGNSQCRTASSDAFQILFNAGFLLSVDG